MMMMMMMIKGEKNYDYFFQIWVKLRDIKYFHRTPLAIADKLQWPNERSIKDFPNNIPVDLDARGSSQDEKERNRKNFETRRQSMALIGRTNLANDDDPMNLGPILTNPKCPSLKISLDVLSSYDCERSSKQRCKTEKCRSKIEKWSVQQPFYVDEPRWVEIELDYAENLPYSFNVEDPFFLTRGKKMFRATGAKNGERSNEEDDELVKFLDEATRSKGTSEFIVEDNRVKRDGSKRKEERRKTLQFNNRQLEDLVRHFDTIDDPFFLSRGKKLFARDTVQEISLDDLETETVERKSHEEVKRSITNELKQSKGNESNEVVNVTTNSLITSKDNGSLGSGPKESQRISSRAKRNSCIDFGCSNDDSEEVRRMKDLEKTILDSSYVQRRNKYSDISDIFEEPFFISRGKKTSKGIDYQSRNTLIGQNESLNSVAAAKRILRLLDSRRCPTEECKDLGKFVSQSDSTTTDRDRRSALDDLLRKYDPFYVARDMWMLFPIVTVMIRVIIGSSDVENLNRTQLKLENVNQVIKPDRIQMYNSNLSISRALGHDAMPEENNIQRIIHKRSAEELNTDSWSTLQKSEILPDDSLPYLPLSERNLRSSVLDPSQEKKSPSFNPWGNKQVAPSRPKSQRPIRMSFNSWGGKRAQGYLNDKAYFLISKGSKDAEKNFADYSKRVANFWRNRRGTPFHSWGGKRSAETEFYVDKNVGDDIISEDRADLYLSEDTFSDDTIENNISESIENEKRAAQVRNNRLRTGFNSWGGKRNDLKDSRSSLSDGSLTFENKIGKSINDAEQQLTPGKRAITEYTRKFYFQPSDMKQSTNAEVEIIPHNYAIHNIRPMRVFSSWDA
ncbi:hypothetical protein KPH14_010573 [Odynerus spinipes]|uniref:Uncharacterized protein n=1 Tax=Odynerus spinipes TaxID=1348599 RepID=A0AAD9RUP3_9HYME|nr:hypothetical protein KPH14_010573 [Odynerus spinipes]